MKITKFQFSGATAKQIKSQLLKLCALCVSKFVAGHYRNEIVICHNIIDSSWMSKWACNFQQLKQCPIVVSKSTWQLQPRLILIWRAFDVVFCFTALFIACMLNFQHQTFTNAASKSEKEFVSGRDCAFCCTTFSMIEFLLDLFAFKVKSN